MKPLRIYIKLPKKNVGKTSIKVFSYKESIGLSEAGKIIEFIGSLKKINL